MIYYHVYGTMMEKVVGCGRFSGSDPGVVKARTDEPDERRSGVCKFMKAGFVCRVFAW